MFWAAFGFGARTELVAMQGDPQAERGGVTARVYKEVLNQHLPPILQFGSIFRTRALIMPGALLLNTGAILLNTGTLTQFSKVGACTLVTD